jgi:hypothetical protein
VSRGLALGLALLALGAAAPVAGQPPLAVGAAAPDTMLPDQRGQAVRLADRLGPRDFLVVAFYVKAFTGG